MGWLSPGGVKYRAAYAAKKQKWVCKHVMPQLAPGHLKLNVINKQTNQGRPSKSELQLQVVLVVKFTTGAQQLTNGRHILYLSKATYLHRCRVPPAWFGFFPHNHNILHHNVPVMGDNHNILAGLTLTRQRHAKVAQGRHKIGPHMRLGGFPTTLGIHVASPTI